MISDEHVCTLRKAVSLFVGIVLSALVGIGTTAAQNLPRSSPSQVAQIRTLSHDDGLVVVKVTDQTGAVVQNADVRIANELTGQVAEGKTNNFGVFQVSGLKPSSYSVRVNALYFRSAAVLHVPLSAAQSKEIEFALRAGEFEITDGVAGPEVPLLPMDSNLPTTLPLAPTPAPTKANFLKRLFKKLRGSGN